jgi:hypothetical protein
MELNEIKRRLEPALRPVEPPTIEEVLEEVSTRGVLRGPVDWVFPAWMLYVEYATQRIIETFQLSEEEKRQLLHFRETLKQVLLKTWTQTKEGVIILRKADGMYKIEGGRVYMPWYVDLHRRKRAASQNPWCYRRGVLSRRVEASAQEA